MSTIRANTVTDAAGTGSPVFVNGIKSDTITNVAGTGSPVFVNGIKSDTVTNVAGTGAPNFPNGIKSDTVTNSAGTGAPNFPNGATLVGVSIATETVFSATAPSLPTGGLWYDLASLKNFKKLSSGAFFEIINNPVNPASISSGTAFASIPNTIPVDQALAVSHGNTYRYFSATNKWLYQGLAVYRWEGALPEPQFVSFRGLNTGNLSGTYTPAAGCISFHVMVWGSTGHGGNNVSYSNLTNIGAAHCGGRAYSERLVAHTSPATYAYVLGNAASLTAGPVNSGPRYFAGTTTFNWGGGTISCTGTGDAPPVNSTGGIATGGSFNANGATAVSSGGGSGSRAGPGNANGSNGGLVEAAGVIPITFTGFRGFSFNPSPAVTGINTGTTPLGSNGKPWYGYTSGSALSSYENSFVAALAFTEAGPFPFNQYGNGTTSHILIIEYFV